MVFEPSSAERATHLARFPDNPARITILDPLSLDFTGRRSAHSNRNMWRVECDPTCRKQRIATMSTRNFPRGAFFSSQAPPANCGFNWRGRFGLVTMAPKGHNSSAYGT
jgi:hypothetical protein